MFSFLKKKKIVSHIKLNGVIGNAGKFKQGIDFAGQEEIIKKAFSLKKAAAVAISINSPGGSPVQSHLIYSFIRQQAKKVIKKLFFLQRMLLHLVDILSHVLEMKFMPIQVQLLGL